MHRPSLNHSSQTLLFLLIQYSNTENTTATTILALASSHSLSKQIRLTEGTCRDVCSFKEIPNSKTRSIGKMSWKETAHNHTAKGRSLFSQHKLDTEGHHLTRITCMQLLEQDSGSWKQQLASDLVQPCQRQDY